MKKLFILVACLMAFTSTINAQSEGWKGVKASYNIFEMEDCDAISAFSIGYVHSFNIVNSLPIFVESGINAIYATGDVEEDVKYTGIAAEIPVNIGYKIALNDDFSLFPYVGVTGRYNITGKIEVSDEEEKADKFQYGWQVGLNASYNNFNIGASYGADFNEIFEKTKTTSIKISVGYNF
ncbi:MAG: porin family protein [Bacteroidaceae bacterium]|nr:porin family protein [Bacteroidaceae bacterium]